MDADLSHDPAALPDLIAPLDGGPRGVDRLPLRPGRLDPELVLAPAPAVAGRQPSTPRSLLGLGVADSTAGFRAYAASVLARIDLDAVRAEGYGFQIEMTYRAKQAGASIVEVPIRFVDRVAGESKMSSAIVVEALGLVTWWGLGRASCAPPAPAPAARRPGAAAERPRPAERPAGSGARRCGPSSAIMGG